MKTDVESLIPENENDPRRGTFDWQRLGKVLKHYRLRNNIKQQELAERTGIPLTVISNTEAGHPCSAINLISLCVAMGINPIRLHSKWIDPKNNG